MIKLRVTRAFPHGVPMVWIEVDGVHVASAYVAEDAAERLEAALGSSCAEIAPLPAGAPPPPAEEVKP